MTVRRASFLGLVGLVFAVWIVAVGCNLDATGFGESDGFCTTAAHCDDLNVCTVDTCGEDGVCVHENAPDGTFPDGVQGNCKAVECEGGDATPVDLLDDVDDGNDCTEDACDAEVGATHTPVPGATCDFEGGLGTCDAEGKCNAACGFIGEDGNEVGCPEAPNDCTLSFCDKSKGICVTEKLDGVQVPGGSTPGECGGAYCIDGEPSEQFAPSGAPCDQALGGGKQGIVCNGMGACVECVSPGHCNPNSYPMGFCFTAACVDFACVVDEKADGTTLPANQQVAGDCNEKKCFGSVQVDMPLDADVPDDNNKCTADSCNGGVKVHAPTAENSACGVNDDLVCDGAGTCVGCNTAGQCGTATDCHQYACNNNTCSDIYPPDNTPIPANQQLAGDCLLQVCDGSGGVKPIAADNDLPNDSNDCTQNQCMGGVKMFPPVAPGSTCSGNRVCDGAGNCLGGGCVGVADCPLGAFCVDGVCCNSACDMVCAACTSALKGGGLQGQCGVSSSGTDNNDSDCPGAKVCDGTLGAAACKLPTGQACSVGGECLSTFCTDGVCCGTLCNGVCQACSAAGVCTNIPNGQDPANECPGVVNCSGVGTCGNLLPNGTACSLGTECQSGFCVDGVCCDGVCNGNCQACNNAMGACTSIASGQDPANECAGALVCDGTGLCKSPTGTTCAGAADCASGFCVDGLCCNNACNTLCKACNVAGNLGTCTNIASGQDPASECAGNASCGGNGACALFPQGAACAIGGECASGNCIDGVCCNNMCGGLCQACNLAGSVGACTSIANGQDPANECAGARVCNGSNVCVGGPLGASCAAAGECASGNCVDGVCCNGGCGGLCQACNLAGSVGTCTSIANGQDPASECAGVTTCNGAGVCTKLTGGAACTLAAECQSGNCVDGVCCNAACVGTCVACNLAGSVGTCTSIASDADPANECAGGDCNGAGACEAPNGTVCVTNDQCISGNCVDGVCCNTACGGTCQACNIGGSVGTCTSVAAGQDPANECALSCNGMGACALAGDGTACSVGGECQSGFCVEGVCCESACTADCKSCLAANTASANGVCDFVDVNTDPQGDCTGAQVCDIMGMCVGGPTGAACGAGAECGTNFCTDGVCCSAACGGTCSACDLAGSIGTCTLVPINTDPDNECAGADVCDGAGACGEPNGSACVLGTECVSGNCVDSVCCDTTCSGLCQACSTFKKGSGANGVCGNINSGADPDADCGGAAFCNGSGACVGAPLGTGCVAGTECASGNCIDSVCCDTTCTGTCQACSTFKKGSGANGVCGPIGAGTDPDMECSGATPDCDGAGMCGP